MTAAPVYLVPSLMKLPPLVHHVTSALEVWSGSVEMTHNIHVVVEGSIQVQIWKQGGRIQGTIADELDSR